MTIQYFQRRCNVLYHRQALNRTHTIPGRRRVKCHGRNNGGERIDRRHSSCSNIIVCKATRAAKATRATSEKCTRALGRRHCGIRSVVCCGFVVRAMHAHSPGIRSHVHGAAMPVAHSFCCTAVGSAMMMLAARRCHCQWHFNAGRHIGKAAAPRPVDTVLL